MFACPIALAYSNASGILWIADDQTNRIRAMQPATTEWKADVKRVVMATLSQNDALPIEALVSIVLDFTLGDSMCYALRCLPFDG